MLSRQKNSCRLARHPHAMLATQTKWQVRSERTWMAFPQPCEEGRGRDDLDSERLLQNQPMAIRKMTRSSPVLRPSVPGIWSHAIATALFAKQCGFKPLGFQANPGECASAVAGCRRKSGLKLDCNCFVFGEHLTG